MCGKSMRFQTAAHAVAWLRTALAVAGTAFSAYADDAVGVMRLSVPSNDAAVVESAGSAAARRAAIVCFIVQVPFILFDAMTGGRGPDPIGGVGVVE